MRHKAASYDRRRILDAIDEQLSDASVQQTRNKKILIGLKPPWEHEEPMWELRVGDYRVFYDVNEDAERVIVRAVRQKRLSAGSCFCRGGQQEEARQLFESLANANPAQASEIKQLVEEMAADTWTRMPRRDLH